MKILKITQEFKNGNKRALVEIVCDRCNGEKRFEHLKHVESGICFKCNSKGFIEKSVILMTKENEEKNLKKKEIANLKKISEKESRICEFNLKQKEIERLEDLQREKNKLFIKKYDVYFRNLDLKNNYVRDIIYYLKSFIPYKPLNLLSDIDKHKLCDILSCSVGRRNSKKYQEVYDLLMFDLNSNIYGI